VNLERPLRLLAFAAAIAGAALFAVNAFDLVRRDVPSDYVEGVVLSAQRTVAAGGSAFDPAGRTALPWSINLYGPVHYQLGAWAIRMGGDAASLRPGRLLSLLAIALALAALWRLMRQGLGLPVAPALFGLLVPLGYLPVLVFAPQNRVDTLAVALSLGGLALVLEKRGATNAAAGLAFVVAVFTKPTAIAAPLAAMLWLLSKRRWRDAALLVATCAAAGLIWLALLSASTHGGFLQLIAFNGAYPFAAGGFFKAAQIALAAAPVPILAALSIGWLGGREGPERLLAGYFLLALFLALATVGKVGANLNYFIEPGFALAPLAGLAWHLWGRTAAGAAMAVTALASALAWTAPRAAWEFRGRTERAAAERRLGPILAGKTVLTMEVASVFRAGGTPALNDPCIFAYLARAKKWDEGGLLAALRGHRIDLVLADADLSVADPVYSNWSPAVRREVTASYRLAAVHGPNLFLYEPKGAP
jgi:hypothetical protein